MPLAFVSGRLDRVGVAGRGPRIRIVTPAAGERHQRAHVFSADVAPADLAVRGVTFFVDGQEACRVAARPFQCAWDAGLQVNARNIGRSRIWPMAADSCETRPHARGPKLFTAAADAIFVPVHVTDRAMTATSPSISRRTSFQLLEDGVLQDISTVLVEDTPIHVFLALDVSGSMTAALPELRKAAGGFLRRCGQGRDHARGFQRHDGPARAARERDCRPPWPPSLVCSRPPARPRSTTP